MKKNIFIAGLSLFVFCFLFAAGAVAAPGYQCVVVKVLPEDGGDVILQVQPGPNEERFTGLARLRIDGQAPGANRLLACILTGISMGTTITLTTEQGNITPEYDTIYLIKKAAFDAPLTQ